MIERQIVEANLKEFGIQEYVMNSLRNLGHSHVKLQKTPLGEKIIIYASRPGLIVGKKGANIKKLTIELIKEHSLPIDIKDYCNPELNDLVMSDHYTLIAEFDFS